MPPWTLWPQVGKITGPVKGLGSQSQTQLHLGPNAPASLVTLDETFTSLNMFAHKIQLTFESGICTSVHVRTPSLVPLHLSPASLPQCGPPPLGRRQEAALEQVLWGDREAGGMGLPWRTPGASPRGLFIL